MLSEFLCIILLNSFQSIREKVAFSPMHESRFHSRRSIGRASNTIAILYLSMILTTPWKIGMIRNKQILLAHSLRCYVMVKVENATVKTESSTIESLREPILMKECVIWITLVLFVFGNLFRRFRQNKRMNILSIS
ncbi:MAG: hypothetical protein C4527_05980 [Candidatus Omnitrophota bacterium]|nr:MAG: hypothetical protein C4527_05980 [Candidatus Omnitrophota bacterium]